MLQLGLSLQVIAQSLDLPLEVVQQAAQTFHEQNLNAFIQLLNSQRALFSLSDLTELDRLIAPLPDDIEELSNAVASWCNQQEHSQILTALHQVRQTLLKSTIEEVSETNSETTTPDYALNKQTLQNAVE